MKNLILFFLTVGSLVLGSPAHAIILLRAPGSSPLLYKEYLNAHPEFQSALEMQQLEYRHNNFGEKELFKLSEDKDLKMNSLKELTSRLRSTNPLSKASWEYLSDFMLSRQEELKKSKVSKDYDTLLCEALFYAEKEVPKNCAWMSVSLDELRAQWPEAEAVFIENKYFDLKGQALIPASAGLSWRLVSNTKKEFSFFGSLPELQKQSGVIDNWVDGQCGQFSVNTNSPLILSNAAVFFNTDCVSRIEDPTQSSSSWISRNKSWLIPTGLAVIGAAAYQLKDKNIVFKNSNN